MKKFFVWFSSRLTVAVFFFAIGVITGGFTFMLVDMWQ